MLGLVHSMGAGLGLARLGMGCMDLAVHMCNIGRVLHHWDFFSTIHIVTLSWRDRFKPVPPFSCGIGWILHYSDVISRISILSPSWRTSRLELGPHFRSGHCICWIGDSPGRQRLPVFI